MAHVSGLVAAGVVVLAGEVGLGTVGQVAARVQAHTENGVARCNQRLENSAVGLGARVRLHVDIGRAEQLLGVVDGQVFSDIDKFTAAVVALACVAFGVFVGQ